MIIMVRTKNSGLGLDYKPHMLLFFLIPFLIFFFKKYAYPKLPSKFGTTIVLYEKIMLNYTYFNLGQMTCFLKKNRF